MAYYRFFVLVCKFGVLLRVLCITCYFYGTGILWYYQREYYFLTIIMIIVIILIVFVAIKI